MKRLCMSGFRLASWSPVASPSTALRASSALAAATISVLPSRRFSASQLPVAKLEPIVLDGESANYLETLFKKWEENHQAVDPQWARFFSEERVLDIQPKPDTWVTPPAAVTYRAVEPEVADVRKAVDESLRLAFLIRAYQVRGHRLARLDPLTNGPTVPESLPELDPATYGFTEKDMDRPIYLGSNDIIVGFLGGGSPQKTLRQILTRLQEIYCGTVGVEYMHIPSREECNWIRERIETPYMQTLSKEEKLLIVDRLTWATLLERFLDKKFNTKRFGIDGCEALIPGMKSMIDKAASLGVENIVIGMSHRGRLNVLANVMRKPLEAVLHQFDDKLDQEDDLGLGSGDVKYHLGTSYDRPTVAGPSVHLTLVANPSHLEAVDPVVQGKTRAKQYYHGDTEQKRVMSVLLHGDAAFAGQGVVFETLELSNWKHFSTGGTVHIVINNQIGFTTDMKVDKKPGTSAYPTDVAKAVKAPVFHVNGDDPEAVVRMLNIAVEYRQRFNKDVVVDIVCYRRSGHNEQDNPAFTQPLMYKRITAQRPCLDLYRDALLKEGVIEPDRFKEMEDRINEVLDEAYRKSITYVPAKREWVDVGTKSKGSPSKKFTSGWVELAKSASKHKGPHVSRSTNISEEMFHKLGAALVAHPLHIQSSLDRSTMKPKQHSLETGQGINWGTAEGLAFGSLLLEGNLVRLSGQDVERGTFSHRHSVLHDADTDETYTSLNHIEPGQKVKFEVHNTPLSEFAALGFELGFALDNPNSLVLWEAQFGDFSNGAQVIIDQFLSSGEAKWQQQCGLVMLLPHAYEGMGPEHSSARLERFLQLSQDVYPSLHTATVIEREEEEQIFRSNIQVVNCSTPANYFHALRRQLARDFRKPLVVFTPKKLLKYAQAVSSKEDFCTPNAQFQTVIPETSTDLQPREKIRKLIFSSGAVYYDLVKERQEREITDVAIVRVEQLAPFPFYKVVEQQKLYPAASVVWAQQEPENMGPWTFVAPYLKAALFQSRSLPPGATMENFISTFEPRYAGRKAAAAPATASKKTHLKQLYELLKAAFA